MENKIIANNICKRYNNNPDCEQIINNNYQKICNSCIDKLQETYINVQCYLCSNDILISNLIYMFNGKHCKYKCYSKCKD
jgi:hypothetical protein